MIFRVKGTQDFLDLRLYNFIVNNAREYLRLYNFHEISTPLIEPLELFVRSLGEQTDVVSKEMFTVATKDDELICLRPEGTASAVRAFIENHVQDLPWRVFLAGPMFRYERPQKGRYRQFHQLSMEIIGANSITHDAECIALLDRLFTEKYQLNSYALQINFLGTQEDRHEYRRVLQVFLEKISSQVCDVCQVRMVKNPFRVFDCKQETCKKLYQEAPVITDFLSIENQKEWELLQEQLMVLSVPFSHQPRLVRGLDYYNKTVFEFVSSDLGAQNAFCGGGRYNNLVKELGGKVDAAAVGAAFGIERLMIMLEQKNLALPPEPLLIVVAPLEEAYFPLALLVAQELRRHHWTVEGLWDNPSLKSMMRHANKKGAAYVLLIGAQEVETQTITVKNMITGTQETVAQGRLVEFLRRSQAI